MLDMMVLRWGVRCGHHLPCGSGHRSNTTVLSLEFVFGAMVGAIVLPVRHYPKYTLHRSVQKAEILDTY